MPDKDGIETIKEMKECTDTPNAKTPVICLTANAVSGMREMYINAGFDDYLTKPIDTGRLENMLLTYLSSDLIKKVADETEQKHKILLVDEDIQFLRRLMELLSNKYEVAVSKSTEQAEAYLKSHETELILMDDKLENLDEGETDKIIRDRFKEKSETEITSLIDDFFAKVADKERREHE